MANNENIKLVLESLMELSDDLTPIMQDVIKDNSIFNRLILESMSFNYFMSCVHILDLISLLKGEGIRVLLEDYNINPELIKIVSLFFDRTYFIEKCIVDAYMEVNNY